MIKFPLLSNVTSQCTCEPTEKWVTQSANLPPITCAVPPEFSGPGGGYTPEDLFAMSVLNCLIASIKITCQKAKVKFQKLEGKARASLNKNATEGVFAVTEVHIHIDITGASDIEKVKKCVDLAVEACPVAHSIKSGKTYNISVS